MILILMYVLGFENPLKWIIESMEEVALDQEAEGFDPDAVSIPIVPLNSDCITAMSNTIFQTVLRCVGIMPPADEQVSSTTSISELKIH